MLPKLFSTTLKRSRSLGAGTEGVLTTRRQMGQSCENVCPYAYIAGVSGSLKRFVGLRAAKVG